MLFWHVFYCDAVRIEVGIEAGNEKLMLLVLEVDAYFISWWLELWDGISYYFILPLADKIREAAIYCLGIVIYCLGIVLCLHNQRDKYIIIKV